MNWIKWSERKPPAGKRCDFLYNGDREIPEVWMLCNATGHFCATGLSVPDYWRPAEKLPKGIRRYSPK